MNPGRAFEEFLGRDVVVDTGTTLLYLGRLGASGPDTILLEDVDVHESSESRTTRDLYIMEAGKLGIRRNRNRVVVRASAVLSMSALDDVIVY